MPGLLENVCQIIKILETNIDETQNDMSNDLTAADFVKPDGTWIEDDSWDKDSTIEESEELHVIYLKTSKKSLKYTVYKFKVLNK